LEFRQCYDAFGVPTTAHRDQAEEILRALAGDHARLREDQWTAIKALVIDRRRVLCVQRTGWGKSAVYFVATALLRACKAERGESLPDLLS
jgi:ATP-dependent DNA helicase RecQ